MVLPTIGIKALVVEVTILHDRGREPAEYHKALFKVDPITKWVNCSKTNLVTIQLKLQYASQKNEYMQQNSNPFLSQEGSNPFFSH
jgi:hypothetical protein